MEVEWEREELLEENGFRCSAAGGHEGVSTAGREGLEGVVLEELLQSSGDNIRRVRRRAGTKYRNGFRTRTSQVKSLSESPPWTILILALFFMVAIRLLIVYSHDILIEREKLSWSRT